MQNEVVRVEALAYRLAPKWGICAIVFQFYSYILFDGWLLVTYASINSNHCHIESRQAVCDFSTTSQ